MTNKNNSNFTLQNNSTMRYFIIISFTILLSACGNKLNNITYAGEKVSKTVNACTEAVTDICNEGNKNSVSSDTEHTEGIDTKASGSWDSRMMLW